MELSRYNEGKEWALASQGPYESKMTSIGNAEGVRAVMWRSNVQGLGITNILFFKHQIEKYEQGKIPIWSSNAG